MSPDLLLTRDLILRPLTASDESAFADLKALSGQETRQARKDFQRLFANTWMQTWLLESKSGQQLVGYLDWSQPNAPFVEISPGCRLHGYASQALDRVSRFRDDLHELCFEIETSDVAAQVLLEKCGYQRVPESPGTRARYRIIMDQQQRQITLEMLDSQYRQAMKDQVLAIHQDLNIARDYGGKHQLELVTEATELANIGNDIHGRQQYLTPYATAAWLALVRAAAQDGESLQPVSAYRSIIYQESIIRRKRDAGMPIAEILKVSAAPGYSEHHSGCAVDVTAPGSATLEEDFENTTAFAWLTSNGARFGFSLSYPRFNKHNIAYEPWHWAFKS